MRHALGPELRRRSTARAPHLGLRAALLCLRVYDLGLAGLSAAEPRDPLGAIVSHNTLPECAEKVTASLFR